jgi:hypothetical protein
MSRVNQIVSNTNTIVKKIVVGTPIKRVSGTLNNIRSTGAEDGQILVYDSASQTFRPEFWSDRFANLRGRINAILDSDQIRVLVDSSYVTSRVNPNLLPDVIIDSNAIQRIVDSAYVLLRSPSGVDSAAVTSIIDSAYIRSRAFTDSSDITSLFPVLNDISLSESSGNTIVISKSIIPDGSGGISLGTLDRPFTDLYVGPNSVVIGSLRLSDSDGTLLVERIDSTGETIPTPATFNFSDSDIQSITTFGYSPDNNTLTISRTGEADLTATINAVNDLTVNGTLKGPSEFVIDPIPHGDAGGRVTIKGRLFVEGDEFITNATTFNMPNAKTIALGGNLDSDIDANAAGIIVGGADTYLRYEYVGDRWVTNKGFQAEKLYGKYVGFESDLGSLNTDNIPEGSTNLYFTNSRADTRINTVVDEAYIQARQLIPGIDSDAVLTLVAGVVDSQYSATLAELLDDLDSARTLIAGVVDSDYVFARYSAVGGLTSSVSVLPTSFQYVFQPSSSTIVIQDSDRSGNTLSFSPTNVDVHVNGLKLTKGIDYSTDDGSIIFLTTAVDSGDTVVVDATRRQAINFKNALVDSSEVIPTTAAASFDIFNKTSFRFVKYTITAKVTVGVTNKYQASELLVTHNDTEAFFTEYGIVQAQDSSLGEVDATVVGSNVRVKFDPTYPNTTVEFTKVSL